MKGKMTFGEFKIILNSMNKKKIPTSMSNITRFIYKDELKDEWENRNGTVFYGYPKVVKMINSFIEEGYPLTKGEMSYQRNGLGKLISLKKEIVIQDCPSFGYGFDSGERACAECGAIFACRGDLKGYKTK